ncbi:MAG: spermidine/putrescine ABC transporter substrate-binding protein [Treponema sp.]|jgi:spermidine/putrescine transport system substrate-binding protein|nr:spermidine/putrescine ABC transporter substrate-binding protein [Treponema sp.]
MRKLIFHVVLLLILPLFRLSAQNSQLVIYTWDEMIPQEILDDFTLETGVEVVLKFFEFNEDMLAELEMNNGSGYDLIIADDYIVDFIIAGGLAQSLDKRLLPNLKNVNPFYQHQFYDPQDEYTVPCGAGIQTIVYNPAGAPFDISGFSDFWNPALRKRLGITANPRVINGMVLKSMGRGYNETDPALIKAAGARLLQLAPNVGIMRDMDLDEHILNGDIDVALMYTDQVFKSLIRNPDLKMVYPKEGIGFGIMPAFIPVNAANPRAAHWFLNAIMEPRRGARCFEYMGYYCTFSASEPYINLDYRPYLLLPTEDRNGRVVNTFGNFEVILNLPGEAEAVHAEIWDAFIKALENQRSVL